MGLAAAKEMAVDTAATLFLKKKTEMGGIFTLKENKRAQEGFSLILTSFGKLLPSNVAPSKFLFFCFVFLWASPFQTFSVCAFPDGCVQ